MDIGRYTVRWDGQDKNNVSVSSGLYFIRMVNNMGRVNTKKMMLVR
jgi:flagellar hook assembly protein FlgD